MRGGWAARWANRAATLIAAVAGLLAVAALLRWALLDAAFGTAPEACKAATGACWAVIGDLWQLFMVGLYPVEERWRVVAAGIVLVVGAGGAAVGFRWVKGRALLLWPAALTVAWVLLRGGAFGLAAVETQRWGGLLLTVMLGVIGQTAALPLGIVLALARRARTMPVLRLVAATYVEITRSLPFVMILLMAALVLPLFMPPGWQLDRFVAAQAGIVLFAAAMIAEVVRGGLAGVPEAQEQAASALGLTWAQATRLVVLPQALRLVQPALIGTVIAFVKGSTLVVAIGLYDLLGATVLASANPRWTGVTIEPLVFVAAIFWAICFSLSRLSARLAKRPESRVQGAAS